MEENKHWNEEGEGLEKGVIFFLGKRWREIRWLDILVALLGPIIISSFAVSLFHAISCSNETNLYRPSRISQTSRSLQPHVTHPSPILIWPFSLSSLPLPLPITHPVLLKYYRHHRLHHLYSKFEYNCLALTFINTQCSTLLQPHSLKMIFTTILSHIKMREEII